MKDKSLSAQKAAILLMVFCTIFTSLGQILWKYGLKNIDFKTPLTLFNIPFIFGFVAYGIGALLMIAAFRKGELSILYPIVATSYVWVSLISPIIFPTDFMNLWKWLGVIMILLAVTLLGMGSSQKVTKNG
ncbi:MAG: hypothetical protein ABIA37_03795 [Candidatus Woesearchaeota archaeon]